MTVLAEKLEPLRAPIPWFGGKSLAAPLIWRAFGDVANLVEPFAGSLATLLARPSAAKVETVSDKDGLIANFWRATAAAPVEVPRWADWPVNEADLHARHSWLVQQVNGLTERLVADAEYYDAKIAGWWVWDISSWIGNGWCSRDERLSRQVPKIGAPGHGIHAPSRKKPITHRNKGVNVASAKMPRNRRGDPGVHRQAANGELLDLFAALATRLRNVRGCCGDWRRVLGRSTLGIDTRHGMTPCRILLDPPYAQEPRDKRLNREDANGISAEVRAWALENGSNPDRRIALGGWEGEHDMPRGWEKVAWRSHGTARSSDRERIWFSPHCRPVELQADLFASIGGAGHRAEVAG